MVAIGCVAPAIALAQPAAPPADAAPASATPEPPAPIEPQPPPQPAAEPPFRHASPIDPDTVPSSSSSPRHGITFEANAGLGWVRSGGTVSDVGYGGLSLGLGAWLSRQTALTFRVAGASSEAGDGRVTQSFAGPSLQYWGTEHVWVGAGVGLARIDLPFELHFGASADLRVGFAVSVSRAHALSVSLEATPAVIRVEGDVHVVTSLGVLLGYQLL